MSGSRLWHHVRGTCHYSFHLKEIQSDKIFDDGKERREVPASFYNGAFSLYDKSFLQRNSRLGAL